jgi:hypothetical protein
VNERKWLSGVDLKAMLVFLRPRASERKARLFACAGCRRAGLAREERSRRAVEAAERYADGQAGPEELWRAYPALPEGARHVAVPRAFGAVEAWAVALWAACPRQSLPASPAVLWSVGAPPRRARAGSPGRKELKAQCALVRDIFGNPFRPVPFNPGWRTSAVLSIAQRVYDEQDYSALPVLADALEDAGCDSRTLLDHCRGEGEHWRGCWAVDAVLGRE